MPAPNLLFLFTDQQRADTMAAYGNTRIETPNLNRLAATSTVFDRAYVTQAVCTPSRSTLLTGLYPHTNGCTENNIPLRPETPCLPEMLSPGKWVTGYFGKWHLGDELFRQHGFDEWVGIEDHYNEYFSPGRDRGVRSAYHHFLIENGFKPEDGKAFRRAEPSKYPEAFSKPAFLARESARFIRQNRQRPFALFVNFLEPHTPYMSQRDGQYDRNAIPLPADFHNPPGPEQPLRARLLHQFFMNLGPGADEAKWRDIIARYWGLCSLVDTHVGTILDTLEECGLMDNTIVVYTSDHGDMMASHQLQQKTVNYEEAVRVPLLVRLPGQRATRRVACPVGHIDLIPTLLDLMGEAQPAHLEGRSLRPVLDGSRPSLGRDVFVEWNGNDNSKIVPKLFAKLGQERLFGVTADEAVRACGQPVRSVLTEDGWKLNWHGGGEHELYHLGRDPHEVRNLVRTEAPVVRELTERIRRWQAQTRDTIALPPIS